MSVAEGSFLKSGNVNLRENERLQLELVDFIENSMQMSHVYQPLLIRSLVDAGGVATVRQMAQSFMGTNS